MQTNNDIIEWEYAMSGEELESLRGIADGYYDELADEMDNNGIDFMENQDLDNFSELCDDIWCKEAKAKSYDECLKIVNNEFFRIIKKYNMTYTGRLKEIL